ncbi:4-alpha-glucanotransferase [Thiomicrorhabdus lithotrophica]|uniref:4-alpha-glucanotransferase n=1 Tax=Thiomicrorhabdus lithotrophica TaxID=2949997 RepID=A0ABY8CAY2_9GAMM|nr:4-alpha-glucanotransferase [Thiomicrorhabdus lithotrophica]WEJ63125.1 4-alpha-glucanotransferase [Thiomicrorhabdus lithotrophica]
MNKRQAGVLLHPTSLPNPNGKPGQLNNQAWLFLDWMESAGLSIWQMLPLTEPHDDLSPYQAVSAFALNPALLPDDWQSFIEPQAFAAYSKTPPHWLEDYALFMAIRDNQNHASWSQWPDGLKNRDTDVLQAFSLEHSEKITALKQQQYVLSVIWHKLKKEANQKGIQLFGDMPIFVAFDSADVWANPDQFQLDEDLNPTVVTGVPPDYFSETGQRWGNPHYNWQAMQADGFSWWRKRVAEALKQFDLVRIDHFRGLEASWEIDATEETAINGHWVKIPGEALLDVLQKDFPDLPLVAEDLGIITDEVVALKEKYALPGMSVLQFGFNGLPDNPHSLHEQVENSVTYTGTHDNDTTLGWFESLDDGAKHWIMEQLTPLARDKIAQANLPEELLLSMPWPLIVAGFESVASRVIVPMQDFLMLDSSHRMNIPGTSEGNWGWQFDWSQVPEELAVHIKTLVFHSNRLGDLHEK